MQQNSPSHDADQDLLVRYYAGECDIDERRTVEALLNVNERERMFAQAFLGAVNPGAADVDPATVLRSLQQLKARRLQIGVEASEGSPQRSPSRWHAWRWPIAGALLGIGLIVGGIVSSRSQRLWDNGSVYAVQMREYVTPKGEQATITLPDESIVVLNVDSRLRVPTSFGTTDRTVYLEGEAQFTVTHLNGAPFSVYASGTLVRELGTVFGIRAYPNQSEARIVVVEGRVSVLTPALTTRNAVVMAQGDFARITQQGVIEVTQNVSVNDMLRWTTGQLAFFGEPVSDVLAHLGRWYDLEFRINDTAVLERRIDLLIPDRRWGGDVLETLSGILRVRGTQVGKVITFTAESE